LHDYTNAKGGLIVKTKLPKIYALMQQMMWEEGQDLAQVGLIIALVAVGATAGMNSVATAVSSAFAGLGATVASVGGLLIR
jgi:Flp pilus assembly pilin Flp